MALDDLYVTAPELKVWLKIPDLEDEAQIEAAVDSATREINNYCRRNFNDSGEASARVFRADMGCELDVDDFHTTVGLVIKTDTSRDGTFATTWDAADYEVEPLNGIVNGMTGWPYTTIQAVGSKEFLCGRPARVQVTARWGWAAVPADVKEAAFILAAENFKLKDAPFGVAGFDGFGAVRVRDNPLAAKKLLPYVIDPVLVG